MFPTKSSSLKYNSSGEGGIEYQIEFYNLISQFIIFIYLKPKFILQLGWNMHALRSLWSYHISRVILNPHNRIL